MKNSRHLRVNHVLGEFSLILISIGFGNHYGPRRLKLRLIMRLEK
jgi:hypothetical protein